MSAERLAPRDASRVIRALEVRIAAGRPLSELHVSSPVESPSYAIASRVLQYTKAQDATGLRIAWNDNIRCLGTDPSCEWEFKIDGASCAMPGPLKFDLYNAISNVAVNIHGDLRVLEVMLTV